MTYTLAHHNGKHFSTTPTLLFQTRRTTTIRSLIYVSTENPSWQSLHITHCHTQAWQIEIIFTILAFIGPEISQIFYLFFKVPRFATDTCHQRSLVKRRKKTQTTHIYPAQSHLRSLVYNRPTPPSYRPINQLTRTDKRTMAPSWSHAPSSTSTDLSTSCHTSYRPFIGKRSQKI